MILQNSTYTFWNLDSVQQLRIPAGFVTQNFSTQQGIVRFVRRRHIIIMGIIFRPNSGNLYGRLLKEIWTVVS
eukprot:SAG25_NODE_11115_length_313_cov_0.953271_1_plen_72_part_01